MENNSTPTNNSITVNGEPYEAAEGQTVLELVANYTGRRLNLDGTPAEGGALGVAVAVGGEVVPRSQWAATPVTGEIDIVTAAQGG